MAVGGMEDKLIRPPPSGTPAIMDPSALRYPPFYVDSHLVIPFPQGKYFLKLTPNTWLPWCIPDANWMHCLVFQLVRFAIIKANIK